MSTLPPEINHGNITKCIHPRKGTLASSGTEGAKFGDVETSCEKHDGNVPGFTMNATGMFQSDAREGMNVFPQCTAIESNISKFFVTSSFGNEIFVASTSWRPFVSGNGLLYYRAQFLYLAACVSMKGQCTNALCNLPLFTRPLRFKRRLLL